MDHKIGSKLLSISSGLILSGCGQFLNKKLMSSVVLTVSDPSSLLYHKFQNSDISTVISCWQCGWVSLKSSKSSTEKGFYRGIDHLLMHLWGWYRSAPLSRWRTIKFLQEALQHNASSSFCGWNSWYELLLQIEVNGLKRNRAASLDVSWQSLSQVCLQSWYFHPSVGNLSTIEI